MAEDLGRLLGGEVEVVGFGEVSCSYIPLFMSRGMVSGERTVLRERFH